MSLDVKPLDAPFGVEITGVDLSKPLSDSDFEIWNEAFEEKTLVLFRDQDFGVTDMIAFSERFGELEEFVDPKDQAEGYPHVLRVTNIVRATGEIKPVEDPGHKSFTLGTSDWHTDSSYRDPPGKASILYGIEVPSSGGDTLFASTAMAYGALPEKRQRELVGKIIIHDFDEARRRNNLPPRAPEVRAKTPPVRQPLVRQLDNGQRALFLGSHAAGIEGMSREDAMALIDELTEWATQPQFVYRHKWSKGDVVMWDNRSTMHRADAYDLVNDRRLLHRTTVMGDGPAVAAQ